MKRGPAIAALVVAVLIGLPRPAYADPRLVTRAYNSNEVVTVSGKLGVQATIGFAENEKIENVAVGDSKMWQITPNKRANLLFVKPLESGARTNMTVVTDKRAYFFDLIASVNAAPVYMLRFTYADKPSAPAAKPAPPTAVMPLPEKPVLAALKPEEQAIIAVQEAAREVTETPSAQEPVAPVALAKNDAKPVAQSAKVEEEAPAHAAPVTKVDEAFAQIENQPEEQVVAAEPVLAGPVEQVATAQDTVVQQEVPATEPAKVAVLNFAWRRKGDVGLMPQRIYDDGNATYLFWSKDQSVPAILIRNEAGEEGPVNYSVLGSTIVIDDVPSLIVLRVGEESATLENMVEPAKSAAFAPSGSSGPQMADARRNDPTALRN